MATAHLNAVNKNAGARTWKISFSYGRALQDMALSTWLGKKDNYGVAQEAYCHRARCNAAATVGKYTVAMENELTGQIVEGHRSDCEDD
jgi:fructose-bisphosphate aldolase class I